jgi:eukaryotic-like serine/threonine-protein kinase
MTGLLKPGTVLRGRYHIVELVGQGGGGAVYRAEDQRLPGRLTAVKEVYLDPTVSDVAKAATQEQFRREAAILAQLDHPALPKVSDYFVLRGNDYLVMDFVAGPDLRQLIDEARAADRLLPEEQVLGWLDQLLDALEYLHGQDPPVIHRDIKPSNLKLGAGGQLKVVDFGLVKPLDPTDPRTLTVARGVGSLPYTPLEQYAGDTGHTDARTDIYSVGATLYHLLTGRPPATAQERFLAPTALARPRQLNPRLSARTESLVLAAMALHPERRPPDVAALRALHLGTAPLAAEPDLGTAPAAWREGLWDNAALLTLAGLLLLLAVLTTWQSSLQRTEPGSATPPATAPAALALPAR